MFHPQSMHSVLKPMFYSAKIIGLSPFNINDNDYNASKLNLFWSISVMFFIGGISVFSLTSRNQDLALIAKITDYLHTHLCVTSLCSAIFFACIFKREIIEVVRDISILDKQLKVLDLKFNTKKKYRRAKICSTMATLALSSYLLILIVLDIVAFTKAALLSIGQVFAYGSPILTTFVLLQFCTFVLLFKERFAWLNARMMELGTDCNGSYKAVSSKSNLTPPVKNERDKTLVIQQISLHHHRLCTISNKLNDAYSHQILLIVLQSFMSLIAISFYIARLSFSHSLKLMPLVQRAYYSNMLILYIAAVILLAVICSNTVKEAQKTGIILHNIISLNIFTNSGFLDLGVACFSLQLLHHNVKFTACRLFNIDETLLYTIVGAATTYLVIVLQFEIGVNSGEKQNDQCLNYTIK